MKKIIVLTFLIMSMCVNFVFADVPSDWAKADVEKANLAYIAGSNITNNYTQNITRNEFCELILNAYTALGMVTPMIIEIPFSDTKNISVSKAYTLGIVNGVSKTEFAPDKNITREEMAVMMERMAKLTGYTEIKADIKSFADYGQVSDWATKSMEAMVGINVICGIEGNKLAPDMNTTREQAITMVWRLYRYLGGEDVPLIEESSKKILVDLNIADNNKLNSNKTITVYEALVAIDKARGYYTEEIGDLSFWYIGDDFAELDYLEDSKKALLLRLYRDGRNHILDYEEIIDMKLEDPLTNKDMLLYIGRMIGDTYGCTDSVMGILGATVETTTIYENAYEKGLISTVNTDNANFTVTYKEFYDVLYKAIYTPYNQGGVVNNMVREIDRLIDKKADTEVEKNVQKVKIFVEPHISDDLSVSWTIPEEYNFILEDVYMTHIYLITDEGQIGTILTGGPQTDIDTEFICEKLISNKDTKISAIRCMYTDVDVDTDYYVDIDVSNVKLVTEGEEINPGNYVQYKNQWCAKEITLSGNVEFESDCYYVLKGYEKKYRKEEYNHIDFECFKVETPSNKFVAPEFFGVHYYDEIHIYKLKISGNAKDGFVVSATPESTNSFVVTEENE